MAAISLGCCVGKHTIVRIPLRFALRLSPRCLQTHQYSKLSPDFDPDAPIKYTTSKAYGYLGYDTFSPSKSAKRGPWYEPISVFGRGMKTYAPDWSNAEQPGTADVVDSEMKNGRIDGERLPTNLLVRYIPMQLSDEEFEILFSGMGELKSCRIIRNTLSGFSYGFGFVDFVHEQDARQAIEKINGLQLQNKKLKVSLARRGEGRKAVKIYFSNMPKDITQDELHKQFSQHGNVIDCWALVDQESGENKGNGFVLFDTREEADAAIAALDRMPLPGYTEPLGVKYADRHYKAQLTGDRPVRERVAETSNAGDRLIVPNVTSSGAEAVHQQQPAETEGEGYTIFVRNILPSYNQIMLWQLFKPYGTITKVKVIRGKGYGFVTMSNYAEAQRAIQMLQGFMSHGGRPLQVEFKASATKSDTAEL